MVSIWFLPYINAIDGNIKSPLSIFVDDSIIYHKMSS